MNHLDTNDETWCGSWLTYRPLAGVGVLRFISGIVSVIIALLVAYWARRNAQRVRVTSERDITPHTAKLVILPVYTRFLVLFALAEVYSAVFLFLAAAGYNIATTIALAPLIQHGVQEGFAFLWMNRGGGMRSVRRAVKLALAWGLVTEGFAVLAIMDDEHDRMYTLVVVALQWAFYIVCIVVPTTCLYRRPALLRFAKWQALLVLPLLVQAILALVYHAHEATDCIGLVSSWVGTVFRPYAVFQALLIDSQYWQGTGEPAISSPIRNITVSLRQPLLGLTLAAPTASSLAEGMDALHSSHCRVPMLHHAYLNLEGVEGKALLGAGGTARVYKGTYKGKRVAVKLIFCMELTPDTVTNFVREASRLHALGHYPNVVRLYGICVRPPSIALVMELCEFGSLYDVLTAPPPDAHVAVLRGPSSSLGGTTELLSASDRAQGRRRIPLNARNRLLLAWQCCKAVAAMHSQSPPVLHLDLKSHNFLVALVQDALGNDGLGAASASSAAAHAISPLAFTDSNEEKRLSQLSCPFEAKIADLELSMTDTEVAASGDDSLRVPETYQWTAPELLTCTNINEKRKRVSTATDCYALGMVLYEVATSRIPFAAEHRMYGEAQVIERILGGMRPPLEMNGDTVRDARDSNSSFSGSNSAATPRSSAHRAAGAGVGGATSPLAASQSPLSGNVSPLSGGNGMASLPSVPSSPLSSSSSPLPSSETVMIDMIRQLWHDNPLERPSAAHVARQLGHAVLSYLPVHQTISSSSMGINNNRNSRGSNNGNGGSSYRLAASVPASSGMRIHTTNAATVSANGSDIIDISGTSAPVSALLMRTASNGGTSAHVAING